MADIKLIKKDTDLSKTNMQQLDWDVVVNGKQYKVYRVPGFVHTIGGRWGENDFWACPRNETPKSENLDEFDGEAVRYGFYITENNYYDYPHKEIIGRHIWWKGKPYTLCTYMKGQCCSTAVPGHIKIKRESDYYDHYEKYDGTEVKLDLLADRHIGWFCEDY